VSAALGFWQSWAVVLALALGTFLIRYSFIGLFANRAMPPWLERSLRLVVPAIFAAIVAGGVAIVDGHFGGLALWPRYAAAAIALGVALRTRGNLLATMIVGMGALHLFTLLRGALS
jgi:branched-subunit amino acid transport protein